ncbi:serine hydrolase domain-containing protein [Sphingomonas cavernae]|uniref:Class A beta-lactamase-related serine hydrolase n=1 Tax=Sphingomonas cavernae TaxID=2320861 RepID=A0A418WLB3_9SPHN|nr:serine hydrolase domain-containing protein [Sphingomonas cavernae]RJF90639.1 class A beta-lactamase-related serine hydrolase [Sphingomonas cavernae]
MRSIKLFAAAALLLAGGVSAMPQGASLTPTLAPPSAAKPIATASASTSVAPGPRVLNKEDVDTWLDGYLPYALRTGDIAGAVVVVVKDGQILTQRGFGYADVDKRTPVDPERTLFRPGSVSKLFTWTAVMQLVEQGKINLDADVNTYLDFKIPPKDGKPATMRQILQHTAGFEDHAKDIMFSDPRNLTSLADYSRNALPKRIYTPGTTPSYSNYATTLAAYVVERVSKQPFDDYVEQHIFKPIGMNQSTFRQPLPKALAPQMATGYVAASDKPSKFEIIGPAPAGSLSSPGADMARFMIAHLNQGAGLMKPETAKLMHDSPLTLLPPLNRMELGFFETNLNGRQVIAHLGDTRAFHTSLHLFMNENVGFYISFNSAGAQGAVGDLRGALFQDFADRYFPSTAPADGKVDAKTAAEHAKLMTGLWRNSRREESNFLAIAGLLGQTAISVNDKGELVIPALTGLNNKPRKWVEIAPFVWRDANGHDRLAAKVVDGKVVRWSMDGVSPFMVFDRVPASQSSSWILPLLYLSLGVLLLTLILWPVAALVRRHYKAPLALEGRERLAYRGVRLGSGLVLAVLVGWAVGFSKMMADFNMMTAASDWWLWMLQLLGFVIFVGAVLVAGWNLWLVFKAKRRWPSKLWAALLLVATLTVLYVAWTFGLIAMTVHY